MRQTYGGTKLANILLLQQMALEQGRATIKESMDVLDEVKHAQAALPSIQIENVPTVGENERWVKSDILKFYRE